jgi:pilus assembly protein CpaB
MSLRVIIMVVLAIIFGGGAIIAGQSYLNKQLQAQNQQAATIVAPEVELASVVVASEPLRFGVELSKRNLKEIQWPAEHLPEGIYSSIDDFLKSGKRIALAAMEINEPVLDIKVTGGNERAGISSIVQEGARAVSVRVNEVAGVAGFIFPGDRVDVILTRSIEDDTVADIIAQNIKVLTVDQSADEREDEPRIAKVVTLEVDAINAQKIALGQTIGTISLVLRRSGDVAPAFAETINTEDLVSEIVNLSQENAVSQEMVNHKSVTIWVSRSNERTQYTVPRMP